MKIVGSLASPFTRTVRVICEELQMPYEFEITPPFAKLSEDQERFINSHNPLMKVPVLIDGGVEVIDSRLIARYLLSKAPNAKEYDGPQNMTEENILTVIYGVVDAGILRFMLKTAHPEMQADSGYLVRSIERIKHGLEWLDKQPALGKKFGVAETLLISGLEWFKKRDIYKWEKMSEISKIYKMFRERESLIKTRIPEAV